VSDLERPDRQALAELELLIRTLGDEMAAWRRRAQLAEATVKHYETEEAARTAREGGGSGDGSDTGGKGSGRSVAELERENAMLQERVTLARDRTRALLERMRFVRQQHATGGEK
jgi:hypothetical protein